MPRLFIESFSAIHPSNKHVCFVEYRQVPFDGFGSVEEVVTPSPGYKNLIYHKLSKPDLSQIEVRGYGDVYHWIIVIEYFFDVRDKSQRKPPSISTKRKISFSVSHTTTIVYTRHPK